LGHGYRLNDRPARVYRCAVRGPWAPAGKRAGKLGEQSVTQVGKSAVRSSERTLYGVSLSPLRAEIGMTTLCV